MLLTISTTHQPARDLGYLLHKHPDRFQTFPLGFGEAHVFYPEASETRCTAALLLEIDPVRLVRRGGAPGAFALDQYVNDRPYVTSSFTSVAIGEVFRSAMAGACSDRPELAASAIPLEIDLPVVSCRGGAEIVSALFSPLGYAVEVDPIAVDDQHPEWGSGELAAVRLSVVARLSSVLTHLYVLLPVLDNRKHYWVGEAEMEKLLRHGDPWLATHPARELIVHRYLRYRSRFTDPALERLAALAEPTDADAADLAEEIDVDQASGSMLPRVRLHEVRLKAVRDALVASGSPRVLDLGCGEGRLLELLAKHGGYQALTGVDVSHVALQRAHRRLGLDSVPESDRGRIALLHGSLTYWDERLRGYDAAVVVEVIEHLEPHRLSAFERVLFECVAPRLVLLTTPNREYNALFGDERVLRLSDHRFEWTRAEFAGWAEAVAARHGYHLSITGIGPDDAAHGAPSQLARFTRVEAT